MELIQDVSKEFLTKLIEKMFEDFNPNKSKFRTFFQFAVNNHIKNHLKRKNRILYCEQETESEVDHGYDFDNVIDFARTDYHRIDFSNLQKRIDHVLTDIERKVFTLRFIMNDDVRRIALIFNKTIVQVYKLIRKIFKN